MAEDATGGDPMGQAKLIRRSLAALSDELSLLGHVAGPTTVSRLLANRGHMCIGRSSDTAAFATASVREWWVRLGCKRYGAMTELLILADSGGGNGCRPRLWKKGLQGLADC